MQVVYGSPTGLSATTPRGDQFFTQASSGVPGVPEDGDRFGWAVAAVRVDFGCDDLAVGVPYEDIAVGPITHTNAGSVSYFRGTTAGLVADGAFVQGQDWVPESPESDDLFGFALAQGPYLQTLDCPPSYPGHTVLAIGAPGEDLGVGGDDEGIVVTVIAPCGGQAGSGDLPSRYECSPFVSTGPGCEAISSGQLATVGRAGEALAGTAPRWGQTSRFLAVGAARDSLNGAEAGRVFLRGDADDDGDFGNETSLSQGNGGAAGAPEAGDRLGSSLALGDFDGDGAPDLAAGAPYEDVNNNSVSDAGGVSVFYGSYSASWGMDLPSGAGPPVGQFFDQDATSFETAQADDHFGEALAAGDFDGDGRDDLAIGVPDENVGGDLNAGIFHVLYGSSAGLSVGGDQAFTLDDAALPGDAQAYDYFGEAVAAGDFDGDGRDDLAISAPGEAGRNTTGGGVYVMYGGLPGGYLGAVDFDRSFVNFLESAGTITIAVERTGSLVMPLNATVLRRPGGTATVGVDYVDFSGTALSWAAGEGGSKSFQITILQDTLDEPWETIVLGLDGPSHTREPNDFTIQIVDDDEAGQIQFLSAFNGRSESSGTANISVRRLNGAASAVTVQYATSDLTATAGLDYTPAAGTLTYGAGQTLATMQVPILADGLPEGGCEYVKLTLSSPGGGGSLGSPAVALLAIADTTNLTGLAYCDSFELGSSAIWSHTWP